MSKVGFKHSPKSLAKMVVKQRSRVPALATRLYDRIEFDPNGGCWLWTGAMPTHTGYGTITIGGQTIGAHRASWEIHHGALPDGLHVCHKCDVRACVNPDHLFLGTPADNIHDMMVKGRANPKRGDSHASRKLHSSDIPAILARLADGESCRCIADSYGVTDCAINAIRRGKSWRHITFFDSDQGVRGANNSAHEVAA